MLAWPYGAAQLHSGFRFTSYDQSPPSASPFGASGAPLINQQWDFIHRWGDISNMVAFRAVTSGQGVDNFTNGTSNQLTIEGSGANVPWSRTFQLPPATAIRYKFMKYGVSTVWEGNQSTAGGNREATTPACGGSLTLDAGSFKF